jgi:hypothetical protein
MYLDQYTVYLQNVLCNALNLRGIAIARLVLNMFRKIYYSELLLRTWKNGNILLKIRKFPQI